MSDKLFKYIQSAIEHDGFLFIGILGDKGRGKSVTGLNLLYQVLGDWEKVLKHTIFTIQDFQNIPYRSDLERYIDGRVKIVLWDDFALHTSSYGFWKADRENLTNFIEEFEIVREYVAVLVVTCATWDMIPPKLREQAHIFIQMTKKGKGEIWKKTRGWLFLRKDYKKIGEIQTEKIPNEIYNRYRQLKHKAVNVKRKMDILRREEKAKELAEKLTEEEWEDEELLIALGIKDVHGNLTEFGELVVKYYNKNRVSQVWTQDLSNSTYKGKVIIKDGKPFIKPYDDQAEDILKKCHVPGGTIIYFQIKAVENNGNRFSSELQGEVMN